MLKHAPMLKPTPSSYTCRSARSDREKPEQTKTFKDKLRSMQGRSEKKKGPVVVCLFFSLLWLSFIIAYDDLYMVGCLKICVRVSGV